MSTHVHMCQYQDTNGKWHDAVRITSYNNITRDTIIDLESHKEVITPNRIENNEEDGCFIYKKFL